MSDNQEFLDSLEQSLSQELESLIRRTLVANIELNNQGLAPLTWGNVSGITKNRDYMVIKPSGVSYAEMSVDDMVILELATGNVVSTNKLRPSTDAPTHLHLYRNFLNLSGICHTHSPYATSWAQAEQEIVCFGTTHADNFSGNIPITGVMQEADTIKDYELNTGKMIINRFASEKLDLSSFPGILVREHGVFAWSTKGPMASVEAAIAIEEIAKMALLTLQINPKKTTINPALAKKHFSRKHGANAYYGQIKKPIEVAEDREDSKIEI